MSKKQSPHRGSKPRDALQAVEDFIEEIVYPRPGAKAQHDYRNYSHPARETVREFFRQNHRHLWLVFVRQKRDEY